MLVGEPGIGKSRTAAEIAEYARDAGLRIVTGRCQETPGTPPFWPWVQVLRDLTRDVDAEALCRELGPAASVLGELIPELRRPAARGATDSLLDSEQTRFRLFDGITLFLKKLGQDTPLLLFLDDLHWADPSTVLLMRFLTREIADANLLVLGSYRDLIATRPAPANDSFESLRTRPTCRQIALRGLSLQETQQLIENVAGTRIPKALTKRIHEKTEGNPFFVTETVRMMLSEDTMGHSSAVQRISLPRSVRDLVRHRFQYLSEDILHVLRCACVIGRRFDLSILEPVSQQSQSNLLATLDAASQAHVVTEVDGVPGRYRFSHAILQDALYEELTASRRLSLHARVAEALEARADGNLAPYLSELSYHFFQAAPLGQADRAVRYARCAAEQARDMLAYEQAVTHLERALQALELRTGAEDREQAELTVALGNACESAGDAAKARAVFVRALEISKRAGLHVQRAQAALGLSSVAIDYEWVEKSLVDEIEGAITALGDAHRGLRAKLTSRLSVALGLSREPERSDRLGREAIELARLENEPSVLAFTLLQRQWTDYDPAHVHERLEGAGEIVRLAESANDRVLELAGRSWRLLALLEVGDIAAADAELEIFAAGAEELQRPSFLWSVLRYRALRALLDGHFEDVERFAQDAANMGEHFIPRSASQVFTAQIFFARTHQGRLRELEEPLKRRASQSPTLPGWRATLTRVHCDLGYVEAARAELERFAASGFDRLRDDRHGLFSLLLLAETAAEIGARDHAERLYAILTPHAEQNATLGLGIACLGSTHHYLGLLADACDRGSDAARHFESALAMNARMGARPWIANTQVAYAEMLRRRGLADDEQRAQDLLARARETADQLGMGRLVARLGKSREVAPVATVASPLPAPLENELRKEGDYWTVVFAGKMIRVRDQVGLRYIAELLHHPGEEFHAAALNAAVRGNTEPVKTHSSDAGPILDDAAKRAYRDRLRDLREEHEEASAFNDPERARLRQQEIDFILAELSGAIGLGGRDRKCNSESERARLNVTKAIRSALRRLAEHHEALTQHLNATIKTGTFVSYNPDPRLDIHWNL